MYAGYECCVYDIHLLILIGMLNAMCMALGFVMEMIPFGELDYIAVVCFWLGSLSVASAWSPIVSYLLERGNDTPTFVFLAFSLTALMYCFFAINAYMYRIQKKYGFIRSELIYAILSMTAKSFFCYVLFAGFRSAAD